MFIFVFIILELMTNFNDYKKTILTALLMAPLFASGIAAGGMQSAYAGAEFLDCEIEGLLEVNLELAPGETSNLFTKNITCNIPIDNFGTTDVECDDGLSLA